MKYSAEEIRGMLEDYTSNHPTALKASEARNVLHSKCVSIIRDLLAENERLREEHRRFQCVLQSIADDAETQTSGSFGMKRLAGYAKDALKGAEWLDEFEKDQQIVELQTENERLREQRDLNYSGIESLKDKLQAAESENKELENTALSALMELDNAKARIMALETDIETVITSSHEQRKGYESYISKVRRETAEECIRIFREMYPSMHNATIAIRTRFGEGEEY